MPWKSEQQRKWGHTPKGIKALGGKSKVAEWDRATKGYKLPKRVKKNKMKSIKKHYMLITGKRKIKKKK